MSDEEILSGLGRGLVKRALWNWTHHVPPWTTPNEKRLIDDANAQIKADNFKALQYNMAVPGAVGAIAGAMMAPRDKEGRKRWGLSALLAGLGSAALGGIASHYGYGLRPTEPYLDYDYGDYKHWKAKRDAASANGKKENA